MKCPNCNKDMKEEVIFTSVNYSCNCGDGWQSVSEMLDLLRPMDFPIKLRFKDADGTSGGVFVGDLEYFNRCPKDRKFKVQRTYDPYIGLQKGMTEAEVAEALYGYKIHSDSEDDGC